MKILINIPKDACTRLSEFARDGKLTEFEEYIIKGTIIPECEGVIVDDKDKWLLIERKAKENVHWFTGSHLGDGDE